MSPGAFTHGWPHDKRRYPGVVWPSVVALLFRGVIGHQFRRRSECHRLCLARNAEYRHRTVVSRFLEPNSGRGLLRDHRFLSEQRSEVRRN